jgi:hypothetical protein
VAMRSCSTRAWICWRKASLRMRMKRQGCMKPTLGLDGPPAAGVPAGPARPGRAGNGACRAARG